MTALEWGDDMRVTYDSRSDMAYIYLVEIPAGGVDHSVVLEGGGGRRARAAWTREQLLDYPDYAEALTDDLVIDLDTSGRILGIEVFGPRRTLPETLLESAETVGRRATYDRGSDVAYIHLVEPAGTSRVDRAVVIKGGGKEAAQGREAMAREELLEAPAFLEELRGDLVFDLDSSGRIVGIKVFQAREQLPMSLLSSATEP